MVDQKLKKILEEFLDGVKINDEYYEIFVNPNQKEIAEAADIVDPSRDFGWDNAWIKYHKKKGFYVRFTAIPNKKLYVFNPLIIHEDLDRKFGIKENDVYIHGIARKEGGRWKAIEAHNIEYMIRNKNKPEIMKELKAFAEVDWSWINMYLDIRSLLEDFKSRIEMILKNNLKEDNLESDKYVDEYNEKFGGVSNKELQEIIEIGNKFGYTPKLFRLFLLVLLLGEHSTLSIQQTLYWPNFNGEEAEKIIKNFKPSNFKGLTLKIINSFKKDAIKEIPPGIKRTVKIINKIKARSTKLPEKKYRL